LIYEACYIYALGFEKIFPIAFVHPSSCDDEQRLAFVLDSFFSIVKEQNDFRLRVANRKLKIFCGANRDRTGNLLVANQALSQLSYSPKSISDRQF
jgi:hypothetical protein